MDFKIAQLKWQFFLAGHGNKFTSSDNFTFLHFSYRLTEALVVFLRTTALIVRTGGMVDRISSHCVPHCGNWWVIVRINYRLPVCYNDTARLDDTAQYTKHQDQDKYEDKYSKGQHFVGVVQLQWENFKRKDPGKRCSVFNCSLTLQLKSFFWRQRCTNHKP